MLELKKCIIVQIVSMGFNGISKILKTKPTINFDTLTIFENF